MSDELRRVFSADVVEILGRYVDLRVEEALDRRERERRWLNVKEAAEYIGSTPAAIRKRIARNTIPHTRDGGRVLIDRRAWDTVLEKSK